MRTLDGHRLLRAGAGRLAAVVLAIAGSTGGIAGPASAWEMRVCADPDRLPFSHRDQTGFENKIAAVLAKTLHADLTFEWFPQNPQMFTDHLRVGTCDIVMGIQDGQATLASTLSYYRSPYVFIQKADRPYNVSMFDDPVLRTLRIGVQDSIGPTHDALRTRGMADNIVDFYDFALDAAVQDVASGKVDVAVTWGPPAGYFAGKSPVPLIVSPVTPEFEPPFTPMYINIAMGVRRGDGALQELLDIAIAKAWDEINAVLEEYHVPTMPLEHPLLTVEGR